MKRLLLAGLLALAAVPALSQVKISALPDGTEVTPEVEFPGVLLNSGVTSKFTPLLPWTFGAVGVALAPSVSVNSTAPTFELRDSDAAANGQRWRWTPNGTTLSMQVCSNDGATCNPWATVTRSTTTVSSIALPSSIVAGSATGGAQGNGSINAEALYVNGVAVSAGGPALTTGTFTATWDVACTTNPTQNFKWVKVGTVVTLTALQDVSCTSDTGGFSTQAAGGLPAAIRPDKQQRLFGARFTDNGTVDVQAGCLRIETDGTMSLFRSVASPCVGTAWTGSGAKAWTVDGVAPAVWTYDIDVVP